MTATEDLNARGQELWGLLQGQVSPARRVLLLQACRLADRLDRLHEANRGDLDPRLLAEARNTTLALRVLLADLGAGDEPVSRGGKLDDLAARRRQRTTGA